MRPLVILDIKDHVRKFQLAGYITKTTTNLKSQPGNQYGTAIIVYMCFKLIGKVSGVKFRD